MEPLAQGAGGMRFCRPKFIRKVAEKVRDAEILVIFDEVMTGFGRTGSYFALSQTGVTTDFLCLSKGLTGGFLPLALTVTTNIVYEAFLSDNRDKAFAHGHSNTANPIACAAALASLKLLKQEKCQNSVKSISESHKRGTELLKAECKNIEHTRILGTISAFEVKSGIAEIKSKCLEEGLLVRPLGNVLYLLPPYSITPKELETAYHKITGIVKLTAGR